MGKKYHFIGLGGIGMSALARILLEKKNPVSGSDLSSSPLLEELKKKGAVAWQGHSAQHIFPDQTVVVSSSIKETNPEFIAAKTLNCPIIHRSELLADLMQDYRTLICTGTHGKTTTSSLLLTVLKEGGIDSTFAIGGTIEGINGKVGKSPFFVAEADESDGTFLRYHPEGAIVTNIEPEHMDYFQTSEALLSAFGQFIGQVQDFKLFFYCGDDPQLRQLANDRGESYGFSQHCSLRITHFCQKGWESHFDFCFQDKDYQDVKVALPGKHNVLNAAAVFGLALRLGIEEGKIRSALSSFPGIGRRCEKRQAPQNILLIDDYAHHPTEIEKTIFAVKQAVKERRLVVLYQPHRYTRTRDTLELHGRVFERADQVYITDIYPAGEEPLEGITPQRLVEKIRLESTVPCSYLPREDWEGIELFPHDVFLTLGAGDITLLNPKMRPQKKIKVGVVFGGVSCEHEISLRSARFVAASLNPSLYEIHYFGIDKQGRWITGEEGKEILESKPVVDSLNCKPIFEMAKALESCDLFLPILHGTYGEDGAIQGFFETLGKPYLGPDVRAASLSMDKVLTKRIVASFGVPTPKDFSFGHTGWIQDRAGIIKTIEKQIPFPVYVKPVQLGSSVGISFVEDVSGLEEAIEKAFRFDIQVMVEEAKLNCRELEFAVIGNANAFPVMVPGPGEKLADGTFVDYERKYSTQSVKTTLYPGLEPHLLQKGKELAEKAYKAVGCSGMTRVDFLLDKEGNYWLFEMNAIPGFQQFSLFPKIWNREGVEIQELLDKLIVLALERKRQQDRHFKCLGSC